MKKILRGLAAVAVATALLLTPQLAQASTVAPASVSTGIAVTAAKKQPKKLSTSIPKVTGTTTVGKKLTAKPGKWTAKTTLSYQWNANGKAIKGANKSTITLGKAQQGKRLTVTVTGKKSGYATAKRTSAQTAVIKAAPAKAVPAKRPARTKPVSAWNCPSWAPIKGNASSRIYHVPGGAYYSRTKPEECFSNAAAARSAGYRASKR